MQPVLKPIDVQYRVCYQFLKHAFGLRYMPRVPIAQGGQEILIRLDDSTHEFHKHNLKDFAEDTPRHIQRPDLRVRVSHHNSNQYRTMQVVDLMIGAAGFYGNRMFDRKKPGQTRMSKKNSLKRRFAKHVYDQLRAIDAAHRGTLAFNWHETTGLGGNAANLFQHTLRMWKFKPRRSRIDLGWTNRYLDKQGRYVRPVIGGEETDHEPIDDEQSEQAPTGTGW